MKSERLKKLESDLRDLEQWLKLGLVPKKDIQKHQDEIRLLLQKIEEEKGRLLFLKESGETEEYVVPKRNAGRAGYPEGPTISDIDMMEEPSGLTESSIDMDTDSIEADTFTGEERVEDSEEVSSDETEEEDEDPFSDKNRWKRGIVDPESDQW